METNQPKRGRPKKTPGDAKFSEFVRAIIFLASYHRARQEGEKHSAALSQAVEFVKQSRPDLAMSQTTAKRILSTFQSRTTDCVLTVERSALGEAEVERLQAMMAQVPSEFSDFHAKDFNPRTKYVFGYAPRPCYPRHNAKPPRP